MHVTSLQPLQVRIEHVLVCHMRGRPPIYGRPLAEHPFCLTQLQPGLLAAAGNTTEATQDVHALAAACAPEAEAKELHLHITAGGHRKACLKSA